MFSIVKKQKNKKKNERKSATLHENFPKINSRFFIIDVTVGWDQTHPCQVNNYR